VVLRDADNVLLDDVSVDDIKNVFKKEARVIEPTPSGLMRGLEDKYEYRF